MSHLSAVLHIISPQCRPGSRCNRKRGSNRTGLSFQTAFPYENDDVVWGYDRTFSPEETLFYPYCDCEDKSILFSRLVRDLVGLDVLLVNYPGYLVTAVHFNENVSGDYIMLDGIRYVVCDPSYIGAPIGMAMPDMDNSTEK